MTRGKRRNGITLSGRVQSRRTEETEIAGTECVLVDDLAARGRITPSQHRAARYFLKDNATRHERAVAALSGVLPKNVAPLQAILLDRETLAKFGRRIMGWKNPVDCETWALKRLRDGLDDLSAVYSGSANRGGLKFPGYGDVDDEDDEE